MELEIHEYMHQKSPVTWKDKARAMAIASIETVYDDVKDSKCISETDTHQIKNAVHIIECLENIKDNF